MESAVSGATVDFLQLLTRMRNIQPVNGTNHSKTLQEYSYSNSTFKALAKCFVLAVLNVFTVCLNTRIFCWSGMSQNKIKWLTTEGTFVVVDP